jgi:hypothetical protein
MDGNYLSVGAEFADLSETDINVGAVYIFNFSTRWNELKKITSVGEEGLIANNFGHSVNLNGDYLIVGSPNAKNKGVVDIFCKKRNWGHLKKIDYESSETNDYFGESVGIYYPYIVIGAFGRGSLDEGRVYLYEDHQVALRIAQEFDVNQEFIPSKASIYLKRSGDNMNSYWLLMENSPTVIDSTNFSSIFQSDNKIILDDIVNGYTGNGYMILSPGDDFPIIGGGDESFPVVNYPIRNSVPNLYNIWIRCYTGNGDVSGSSNFKLDLMMDGIVIKRIDTVIADGEWSWVNTSFILPDTQQHILGIRIKEKLSIIDKIYIDNDMDFTPEDDGPQYSIAAYVTVHVRLFDGFSFSYPISPIYSYDYKTTLEDIIQDDWYNFNIKVLDTRGGYSIKEDFTNNYFLVVNSTGKNEDNFVLWEFVTKDEYSPYNSCIKI